jgi:hypothetical protein
MTDIDRLRNEYIDAAAKAFAYRRNYEDMSRPPCYYAIQRAEAEAASALLEALKEPHRTGWFTAYIYPRTENSVRVRRNLQENGRVRDEDGYMVSHGLDAYTDIQWEDDAKQEPTEEPPVRQYTEEQIRKALAKLYWFNSDEEELIAKLRRTYE